MSHIAVDETVNGEVVTWMEPVSDKDYRCRIGSPNLVSGDLPEYANQKPMILNTAGEVVAITGAR